MKLKDMIRLFRKLSKEEEANLVQIGRYLDRKTQRRVKSLLKQKRVSICFDKIDVSPGLLKDDVRPRLDSDELEDETRSINLQIEESFNKMNFEHISRNTKLLHSLVAPHISGLEHVKRACLLQLFSKERLHILLLGDPGTGKTDILRAICSFSPVSSFGLGSGSSGVGLSASVKGKTVVKGLLPQADNGLCCIDELNLMKKDDRASLYNAMEKGFVTYDKGGSHIKMDARVKVLATANPTGDKFAGKFSDTLRKQLPFDPALLSRFHLVFLIRSPDIKKFVEISKKIVRNDAVYLRGSDPEMIKKYVEHSESIDVKFPKHFEGSVARFVESIKKDEKKFLVDISPRIVVGLIRLSKAITRMHLRDKVSPDDLEQAKKLLKESLYIRK